MSQISNMIIIVYLQRFSLLIMQISIMQWQVEIGIFNPTHKTRFINLKSLWLVVLSFRFSFRFSFCFCSSNAICVWYIELNLGPKKELLPQFLSLPLEFNQHHCTQFCKIDLLQAYNTIHQYGMICLSESYIKTSVSSDKDNLNINSYKLIRADHPGNAKRGGVCLF